MIKIKRRAITAVILVMAFSLSLLQPAEAGLREVLKKEKPLPTIELKDVKLRGTVVSGVLKPIAIIEDTLANKNYWYKEGDTLCNGRIVEIQRGAIILEMNGSRYLFGLPEGEVGTSGTIALSNSKGKEKIRLGRKTGDNEWEVKLDDAIEVLTNASKIMKEARIRPYFAIGKAAGIRIDRIEEESVIKKMGLKDGDVIKGVNGFGLMSPTKVFEAYRKYKYNRLIQLQLLREEELTTLTYNIIQ